MDAWRAKRLSDNGKRPIVFRRADGYEDMQLQVPCGKCLGCKADKSLHWAIRMYQEASMYDQNSFLTLTYNDDNLPPHLDKKHVQDFIRSVRKEGWQIRYYAVGEYGDATNRPHYHLAIFGADFKDGTEYDIDGKLYSVPAITSCWGKGNAMLAEFNMATACYIAGYVTKKVGAPEIDMRPLMSRKPGIGFPWLAQYVNDVNRIGSVIIEGKEYPVPPQYFRWAEENISEAALSKAKYKRRSLYLDMTAEERLEKRFQTYAKEIHLKSSEKHKASKQKI